MLVVASSVGRVGLSFIFMAELVRWHARGLHLLRRVHAVATRRLVGVLIARAVREQHAASLLLGRLQHVACVLHLDMLQVEAHVVQQVLAQHNLLDLAF